MFPFFTKKTFSSDDDVEFTKHLTASSSSSFLKSLFGVPELLKDCTGNISCATCQFALLRTRLPVKRPKPSLSVVFNLTI